MFSLVIYILTTAIGFIMGVLYKRAITTAQFFNPNPKRLSNIFLIIFCAALFITLSLMGWMVYQLTDSKIAEESVIQFTNTKQLLFFFINLFFLTLVILSNIYSQSLKKIAFNAYFLTALFYVSLILIDAFVMYDHYIMWQELMTMDIARADISGYHKTGLVKAWLGVAVTVFNAGVIWWGMKK